jgi:hypothetical protein
LRGRQGFHCPTPLHWIHPQRKVHRGCRERPCDGPHSKTIWDIVTLPTTLFISVSNWPNGPMARRLTTISSVSRDSRFDPWLGHFFALGTSFSPVVCRRTRSAGGDVFLDSWGGYVVLMEGAAMEPPLFDRHKRSHSFGATISAHTSICRSMVLCRLESGGTFSPVVRCNERQRDQGSNLETCDSQWKVELEHV